MSKSISSQPGAGRFRSILVIIITLICMSAFFAYTGSLADKAEKIARDRVISDIQYALAMMLYDYTIKGKPQALIKFDRENPFVPLAIYRQLPGNYHGTITALEGIKPGWYFDTNRHESVFFSSRDTRHPDTVLQMRYESESQGENRNEFGQLVIRGSNE